MAYPNDPPAPSGMTLTGESINTGLVGFWPLTDGTGTTATDLSTSGNDGTQSGGVGWASTTRGTAADFDGSNDLFTVSHDASISFDVAAGSTFSAWVAPDTVAGGATFDTTNPRFIFAKYAGNPNTANYWLRILGGYIDFGYRNSANTAYVTQRSDSEVVSALAWNHVAAVHNGTSIDLYLNGVEVASSTTAGTVTDSSNTNTDNLIIGSNGIASNRWFDGKMQNARIWSRALSSTEVATLYSTPWTGTSYTDVTYAGYYLLDEPFKRL